jgi:hypothetical protein
VDGWLRYLCAMLAHVRLFARVYSSMDCERGSLDELLSAAWPLADVRPHASVDTF